MESNSFVKRWWKLGCVVVLVVASLGNISRALTHMGILVDEAFPVMKLDCESVSVDDLFSTVVRDVQSVDDRFALDGLALLFLVRECNVPEELRVFDFSIPYDSFPPNTEQLLNLKKWETVKKLGTLGQPDFLISFITPAEQRVSLRAESTRIEEEDTIRAVPIDGDTQCEYEYKHVVRLDLREDLKVVGKYPFKSHLRSLFGHEWSNEKEFSPLEYPMNEWHCAVKNSIRQQQLERKEEQEGVEEQMVATDDGGKRLLRGDP